MPVLFSRACEYAIQGLVEMARHPEKKLWRIQDIAQATNTPAPFLSKTFQILVKGRILSSTKGRGGGFSFAVPTKNISMMDIVNIIDGSSLSKKCALGLPECSGESNPCPFHEHWGPIRDSIIDALRRKTLDEFARKAR
ncbi:MAG: RrF2 family transcriptional regulator [bacterium]